MKTLKLKEQVVLFAPACDLTSELLSQVLEGRPIYVDCYGNLAPLTKASQQLVLNFYAFKENRLPFCVKVPHAVERQFAGVKQLLIHIK